MSGTGMISVANAYLEGGASVSKSSTPGKALGDNVKLAGTTNRNLIDGENVNDIDYDNDTYWRDILTVPNLSLYPVDANAPGETTEPEKPGETTKPEKPGETTKPEKPGEATEPEKPGETTEPEKPSSGGTDTNTGKDKQNKTKTTVKTQVKSKKNASVKTGDSSKPILWAVLMVVAIAGITRSLMLRKKN